MSDAYLDELTDHIRRIAQEVVGRAQFKGTLVCTGYDKATHSVKGIIQPHGIESGWVPLASLHVGNGFGIVVGPRVGSADKLDGQVFDVHFDGGDPDTLVAHHRQFSTQEKPPQVEPGEMLVRHESGSEAFFDKDGQLALKHGPSGNTFVFAKDKSVTVTGHNGSTFQIDPDGNHVHDTKGKAVTIKASSLALQGDLALTGGATLNGQPIATA